MASLEEFRAIYGAYFGPMPIDDKNPREVTIWTEYALRVRDPKALCDAISTMRTEQGAGRSKPRLELCEAALAKMNRVSQAAAPKAPSEFEAAVALSKEPLFDCSQDPPRLRRTILKVDLPAEHKKELNEIVKAVIAGQVTSEEAKRLGAAWWMPTWEKWSAEEQTGLRRGWTRSRQAK